MSEQVNTNETQSDNKGGCASECCVSGRHHKKLCVGKLIGIFVLVTIGFFTGKAFSSEHGWCHEGQDAFVTGHAIDHEKISMMAEKRLQHVLSAANASTEQKTKANGIIKNSEKEMVPLAEKIHNNHLKLLQLLAAKDLDKAAVEQTRIEQVNTMDEISKHMTQTILAIADLLTPEQRLKLADLLKGKRGWLEH
jgi:Spy/CpxP family protein refolding chaperone